MPVTGAFNAVRAPSWTPSFQAPATQWYDESSRPVVAHGRPQHQSMERPRAAELAQGYFTPSPLGEDEGRFEAGGTAELNDDGRLQHERQLESCQPIFFQQLSLNSPPSSPPKKGLPPNTLVMSPVTKFLPTVISSTDVGEILRHSPTARSMRERRANVAEATQLLSQIESLVWPTVDGVIREVRAAAKGGRAPSPKQLGRAPAQLLSRVECFEEVCRR